MVFRAKVVHGTVLIKMSTSADKGDEVATDSEEIVRPVYADDIPQNIRDGFDHTRNYIKQCHDALDERIDEMITRFDGLADIINRPAMNFPNHKVLRLFHCIMHHQLATDMPACMIAIWRHTLMLEMMALIRARKKARSS